MKSFDCTRFRKTFLWVLADNRSKMITFVSSMFIVFFLNDELFLHIFGFESSVSAEALVYKLLCVSFVVGYFGWLYFASTMFTCVSTKSAATKFLTHPSSNLEKYLSLWLYGSVVSLLLIFVAWLAAELLCCGFNRVMGWRGADTAFVMLLDMSDHWSDIIRSYALFNMTGITGLLSFLSRMVFIHSLFVLGSAFFRCHKFILTASGILLFQLFMLKILLDSRDTIEYHTGSTNLLYILTAVYTVFSAACYALSYRLFRRTNIVGRKWFNI